jgi:hypothetical protein
MTKLPALTVSSIMVSTVTIQPARDIVFLGIPSAFIFPFSLLVTLLSENFPSAFIFISIRVSVFSFLRLKWIRMLTLLSVSSRSQNQHCGSMTFWCGSGSGSGSASGSGSCYFRHWPSRRQQKLIVLKKKFFLPYYRYFLKVHLHHFQRQKVKKKSQSSRNQGFLTIFAWW